MALSGFAVPAVDKRDMANNIGIGRGHQTQVFAMAVRMFPGVLGLEPVCEIPIQKLRKLLDVVFEELDQQLPKVGVNR